MTTLISSPTSPFVRTIRILIEEAGIPGIEEAPVATTPLASAPQALAANPLGKIPALIREDGPAIYDSRIIARYLDATHKAGLYPEGSLWEILTLEATAHGIMEAAVLGVYEGRLRPEEKQFPDWVEAQWGKVERGLDATESLWMSHLVGPMNMAQIAMGCALGYLDFRFPERDWRKGRVELANWYDGFAARPSMKATVPE